LSRKWRGEREGEEECEEKELERKKEKAGKRRKKKDPPIVGVVDVTGGLSSCLLSVHFHGFPNEPSMRTKKRKKKNIRKKNQ